MSAEARFESLPHGWAKQKCSERPGVNHDGFLTGRERVIETPSGRSMTEAEHECRKCGAKCRWVKL